MIRYWAIFHAAMQNMCGVVMLVTFPTSLKISIIPYPFVYNHWFLFFNMGFWVSFKLKNPSKKGDFLTKKLGFIQEKNPNTGLLKRGSRYGSLLFSA